MTRKIFYVYKDCTKDGRVFYIGKGQYTRVKSVIRNKLWCKIARKYGHYREIVLGTRDERYAFEIEVDLIKTYKTFIADWENGIGWGANLTRGGDGTSGIIVSKETRLKMSQAKMGSLNINFGKPKSKDVRQKISNSNTGKKRSKEVINNMSKAMVGKYAGNKHPLYGKIGKENPNFGRVASSETKEKISFSHRSRETGKKINKKTGL